MHTNQTAKNYLLDLGQLLTEYSVEAKKNWLNSSGTDKEQFESGYLMGLHRAVTLMQQQAMSFGISQADLGLGKINEEFFFDHRSEL